MKTVSLIFSSFAVCLLQPYYVSGQSNNVYANLTRVVPRIYRDYMQADWDDDAPSGYVINVPNPLNASYVKDYAFVKMYTRENGTKDRKEFFEGHLCDLLDPSVDKYPKDNFLPRQLIKIIFFDFYGSCDMESGRKPIGLGGPVNTDPKNNPDLEFPKSKPFEVIVCLLPNQKFYLDDPWDWNNMQVYFQIDNVPEEKGKNNYYCLNTQWNYYLVWRICTMVEFIESTLSGIGRKFIQIF